MNISDNITAANPISSQSAQSDLLYYGHSFGRTIKNIAAAPLLMVPGKDGCEHQDNIVCSSIFWVGMSLVANYLTLGLPASYVAVGTGAYTVVASSLVQDMREEERITTENLTKLQNIANDKSQNEKCRLQAYYEGYERGRSEAQNAQHECCNEGKVYKEGYDDGYDVAYEKGYEEGRLSSKSLQS